MDSLLDKQLQAGLHGDFDLGWKLLQQLEGNPRANFNKGWYLLRQGKLQEGHKLLDTGRFLNVFGNKHIGSSQPIWNDQNNSIVLMNLEGGLGDQIHSVRWVKDIIKYNNKVVVSCSGELAPLFVNIEGVSAIVQHEAALGVYHDYWIPTMSMPNILNLEYNDLSGKSYIPNFGKNKKRIGLKWAGNPKFEHEQHRLFPEELMFSATKGFKCISLQKENDNSPDWIEKVNLDTWKDTAKAISSCDLIISSCTSIAHLAGAMGIETWIIIPILSYYLWALPGEKTPYYNSVTLLRQEEYGDWKAPFNQVKKRLNNEYRYLSQNS